MKGITPTITIVLLLLVAIGITGVASLYLSSVMTRAGTATEEQFRVTTTNLAKAIRIDNAKGTSIVVRNIGTDDVTTSSLGIYVNGMPQICTWDNTSISSQKTATCTLTASCSGSRVKVIGPANEHSVRCE